MSIKLTICLDKNTDLAAEGFSGNSCHVAIELNPDLMNDDLQELQHLLRAGFDACVIAVADEIHRHQANIGRLRPESPSNPGVRKLRRKNDASVSHGSQNNPMNTSTRSVGTDRKIIANETPVDCPSIKPATRGQRRVIKSICRRLNILAEVGAANHHVDLTRITRRQASLLLDQLRNLEKNPAIGHRVLSEYADGSGAGQANC